MLMGRDAVVMWVVSGTNSGTYDGQTFTGMEDLEGGSMADVFDLQSGGSLSGSIEGGAGANTYQLNGGTVTGGITAGDDGDTFDVNMAYTGDLTGGAGDDTFDIDAEVTGSLDGAGGEDRFELAAAVTAAVSGGAGDRYLHAGVRWFGEQSLLVVRTWIR